MLRRLHKEQPDSFEFTPANLDWARAQMTKYPEGRQQSAIIPILWRAQEQEGWLTRPAMEYCRRPAGHGLYPGAGGRDLLLHVPAVSGRFGRQYPDLRHHHLHDLRGRGSDPGLPEKIAPTPHTLSADGRSVGKRSNAWAPAPMRRWPRSARIIYEDLTGEKLRDLIGRFSKGEVSGAGLADRALCGGTGKRVDQPEGTMRQVGPSTTPRRRWRWGSVTRSSGSTEPKFRWSRRGLASRQVPRRSDGTGKGRPTEAALTKGMTQECDGNEQHWDWKYPDLGRLDRRHSGRRAGLCRAALSGRFSDAPLPLPLELPRRCW
jgi:NADH-quinone oxidoreductase subunit E